MNSARVVIYFLSKIYGVISPSYFFLMSLQGLDPSLSGYEVAIALYKREAGPKPEKACHFFSLSMWF